MKILFVLLTLAASAQQFEVATIHPAEMPNAQSLRAVIQNGGKLPLTGLQVQGSQVNIGLVNLQALVALAYEVPNERVTAPEASRQQRYNIQALVPTGADPKQMPLMLRSLLKERFKLVVRQETRDDDVLALEVDKSGHKLKEVTEPVNAVAERPLAAGEREIQAGGESIRVNQGVGLATVTSAQNGSIKMSSVDGKMRLDVQRMTMKQFINTLGSVTEFPLVDRTNLTGEYAFVLDVAITDLLAGARRSAAANGVSIPATGPAPIAGGGAQAGNLGALAAQDPGGSLEESLKKLGLRLRKTKAAQPWVVVESADNAPSEN
jgi:uncharacterized protein (TIGR03435 family)